MSANAKFVFSRKPMFRLVLDHKDWPHPTHSRWQESQDFSVAIEKAKQHGITWSIEKRLVDPDRSL